MKTFKELNQEKPIEKRVVKCGTALGIVFTKEDIKKFSLDYNDTIILDNAEIIKITT